MAIEITMPKLSDTMAEGTILSWRVKQGDRVSRGDIIAEVETDKAAMEMEAFEDGVIASLAVQEGETVAVGTVIAVIETAAAGSEATTPAAKKAPEPVKEEAEPAKEEAEPAKEEAEPAKEEAEPAKEKAEPAKEEAEPAKDKAEPAKDKAEPAKDKVVSAAPETPAPQAATVSAQPLRGVSPAARALARERGLDLAGVRGTGPGGRVVLADVERSVPKSATREPADSSKELAAGGKKSVKIRRLVAQKMVESWQNIPHFFVTVAVDMTDIIRFRKDLGVSVNDFILEATARSLKEHPWVNSFWGDGEGVEQPQINISMAVATERGLYNPVVHDCAALSLKEISKRAAELADKAHRGKLTQQDMEGGTFTISNMGMLGVETFSAIITPPQAAVLAVGTIRGEVVVDDKGEPGIAPILRLTLSADHRILDGADAADFLTTLKSYLEAPVTLLSCS
ncbi:MAG: dihydrolipoamide acetyltransferase family protein [Trichloromonadaceae bacterium]